jgi:hypothetical protein
MQENEMPLLDLSALPPYLNGRFGTVLLRASTQSILMALARILAQATRDVTRAKTQPLVKAGFCAGSFSSCTGL